MDVARDAGQAQSQFAVRKPDFIILDGDPLSVYSKVLETWVEGQRVFDRSDPKDYLFAVGGFGAGHDQRPYFCCFDQTQQGESR